MEFRTPYHERTAKMIRRLLFEREMSFRAMGDILDESHQNFHQKCKRGGISFAEMLRIADKLNADIIIIDKATGKKLT